MFYEIKKNGILDEIKKKNFQGISDVQNTLFKF